MKVGLIFQEPGFMQKRLPRACWHVCVHVCVHACACMFACPLSEQVPKRMVGSNQGFLPGLPLEDGVLFRGLNILVYFIASCPPSSNRNSTLENLNFDKESNNFPEWFLNLFTHFNEHLGTLIQ